MGPRWNSTLAAAPSIQPFNHIALVQGDEVVIVFSPSSGGARVERWVRGTSGPVTPDGLRAAIARELGWQTSLAFTVPLTPGPSHEAALDDAASRHVGDVRESLAIGRVRGIGMVPHLIPYVQTFLRDHPDPDRNVLIMMRFQESDHLKAIHAVIRDTLTATGMIPVRADDKDYTGELWSNLQLYMTGCHFGVAVFEDIDNRDFNPNVSLELGYMLGTGRRVLLLKEQRLATLPADVVNRLYKPFDMFRIDQTISSQVNTWVKVDLGIAPTS